MLSMLAAFLGVLVLDQVSKTLVIARLAEGAATSGTVLGARFRHVTNRRGVWASPGKVKAMTVAWLPTACAVFVVAAFIDSTPLYLASGAAMAGAASNLVDGNYRRAITDFIDLRVWPVFNLADAAIVAGVTFILWNVLRLL